MVAKLNDFLPKRPKVKNKTFTLNININMDKNKELENFEPSVLIFQNMKICDI